MKAQSIYLAILGLLFSANAYAVNDMNLKVINKTCDIKSLAVTATDQYQLRSGMLIEFSQVSEDESKKCAQAVVYMRLINQAGKLEDKKSIKQDESAALMNSKKRVVCRNKADNSVISDNTTDTPELKGGVSISAKTDKKTQVTDVMMVMTGSSQCPNGNLTIQAQSVSSAK
jgi:hypothetical protein